MVSNDAYNKHSADAVMVPLTSVLKETPFSLAITSQELARGTLLKPSRIRTDKLFSIEQELVQAVLGRIDQESFAKVKHDIMRLF